MQNKPKKTKDYNIPIEVVEAMYGKKVNAMVVTYETTTIWFIYESPIYVNTQEKFAEYFI